VETARIDEIAELLTLSSLSVRTAERQSTGTENSHYGVQALQTKGNFSAGRPAGKLKHKSKKKPAGRQIKAQVKKKLPSPCLVPRANFFCVGILLI